MAEFEVHRLEGTQYVDAHVDNESIRAEAGALSYYTGDIEIESQLIPSPIKMMRSVFADEAIFCPVFSSTGVVTLESSLGRFHVLDPEVLKKRAKALYDIDAAKQLRKSHENPYIQRLYKEFLGVPNGEKSHELLHTSYQAREPKGIR